MSAYEAGRQFGNAAFPFILIAIGVWVGWRMGRKREPRQFVLWPVAVAVVLAAVSVMQQANKHRESETRSELRR